MESHWTLGGERKQARLETGA
ncbi:hypothetical protein LPIBR_60021 [Lacticaseibacillus paracasei]|nr:hypothetical protein LPIBR_60021 [Lacticaseibacillus paracasei]